MTAGGANFYRLLKPYVIGAFIIGGLHLVLSNYIVPNGNKKRTAFENQYIWKNNTVSQTTNIHMNLSPTESIYMSHFYADTKTGTDFTYEKFDAKGELVYKLKALQIVFTKDNKWRLTQCNIKTMDGLKETLTNRREIDTTYQFSPNDFVRRDNFKETMTSSELKAFIDATKMRGLESPKIYEVELYKRTAEPFSILILTLIGVAVASRKVRGGMGWHLLTGAVTGGIFIFMTKFSSVFSTNASLPPSLGVWMPNIIFGAITLFLLTKAQK
jgi:lipopolysaccharide export system permease protein